MAKHNFRSAQNKLTRKWEVTPITTQTSTNEGREGLGKGEGVKRERNEENLSGLHQQWNPKMCQSTD